MSLAKRLGKSATLRGLLCWLVAGYIRLVWLTSRWAVHGGEGPTRLHAQGRPFILAFWHGRLLMMPKCWSFGPITMLISHHRDGQLIARTVGHFGIEAMSGSSSRGGANAVRGLLKILKGGHSIGITPDGPRGPRMRASDGVVSLARLSGVPVIPVSYSCAGWTLRSWDCFLIPRPFTRGVFVWGEPTIIPKDCDPEAARAALEERMTRLSETADRLVGRDPVRPAPIPVDRP